MEQGFRMACHPPAERPALASAGAPCKGGISTGNHGAVVDAWPEEKLLGTEADCDLRKQLRNVVGNSCNERKLKSKVHDTMDCVY